jgi:Mor family transcriptional regulator
MGQATQESTKRNQALYRDYKAGAKILTLQKRYDLSASRVHAIVKREKEREAKRRQS